MVKPRFYYGIIGFIVVMLIMYFIATPIQVNLGMVGVLITELILLACGLIPILVMKWDLKEVFGFKIPQFRQIFGTLILWIASYFTVLIVTLILAYFFPDGMIGINSNLQGFFKTVPLGVRILIVAVSPAICEEVLHRGFILYSFKNVKNKAVVIISMGIIFGLFHMDIYRFLPTGILGAVIAYIMIETKNITLAMLFHFVNNLTSVLSSQSVQVDEEQLAQSAAVMSQSTTVIGSFLIIGVVVPFLFLLGNKLIHEKKKMQRKSIIIATIIAVVMFISGVILVSNSIDVGKVILNTSETITANKDTEDIELPNITIERTGIYEIFFSGEGGNKNCRVELQLCNSNGEIVFRSGYGAEFTSQNNIELKEDIYSVRYCIEAEEDTECKISVNTKISMIVGM